VTDHEEEGQDELGAREPLTHVHEVHELGLVMMPPTELREAFGAWVMYSAAGSIAGLNVVLELVEAEAIQGTRRGSEPRAAEVPENAGFTTEDDSPVGSASGTYQAVRAMAEPVLDRGVGLHDTRKVESSGPAKTRHWWGRRNSEGIGGVLETKMKRWKR